MQNGNAVKIAYGVLVVLLGLVIFILAGFRQDVASAQTTAIQLQTDGANRESRVCVLEANIADIKDSLKEINKKLDRRLDR